MERIHVCVRARPLSPEDARSSPWRVSGNAISLSTQPSSRFEFDRVFGEDCRTADVYEARTKHIVDSAVRGFNGTVFAYGQTNSGKTYTMRGSANGPGIIPLAVHDLFQSIQENVDREFLVRMSYMEIYNEEINDLLVPEHRKLQIHESIERGIYVAGLREEIVTCPEQVLDFMAFGESHRHIGETNMNLYSSRSHTIFRMIIESREKVDDSDVGDSCDAVRVSVLNLVDLAGSERAAKTGAEGMRLKEGSHINKSLMTLGTVIKKLSEGTESQGGHVPYRDSKLTRILQPALGGNANTAIICNITLAQVHADETKSSLQFASRALRVTNCACVNEILTDAALLKRQRKEIEELRAKLRNSQSEHWEEEILNLRNTLLQSELEKERIVLELEEEKKAKEQRERRLIEQAKKIENLSSLVLNSERDDKSTVSCKNKRRVTWCPGPYSRQFDVEVLEPVQEGCMSNSSSHERNMGMPLPFEELMQEGDIRNGKPCTDASSSDDFAKEGDEDVALPDAHALLHVTSRRKPNVIATDSLKKQEQGHIESRTLTSTLIKPGDVPKRNDSVQSQGNISEPCAASGLSARESEAILVIKQLQDQIKLLELEKASIQNNLDNVLELATQQKNSFSEKYEELHQNCAVAHEEARIANEKLSSLAYIGELKQERANDSLSGIWKETLGMALQIDQSKCSVDNILSFVEELLQNLSMMAESLSEAKSSVYEDMSQFSSVIRDFKKASNCLTEKISKLESEKELLHEQSLNQQNELQRLKSTLESCEKAVDDRILQHELEKDSILSEYLNLQKEVLALSSSSLMKEKESIRKELEKTKTKLRETESKLKNSIQDKIKLESEKAQAEREMKKLQNQRSLLERDLRKRDSLTVDKRHEISSKQKELAGIYDQALQMQEDYQNLEAHACDMEVEITSLREALIASIGEKEEALSKVKLLTLELEDLENKLHSAELEIQSLKEEAAIMTQKLDASESTARSLEISRDSVSREKEDMGMQLTDALLEMEAEKSIWIAKEKALVEDNERLNISNDENCKLLEDLTKVRQDLECCREQCRILEEKMVISMENYRNEEKCCTEDCEEPESIFLGKEKTADDVEYDNDLCKQLLIITEERDSLLSEKKHMSLIINEAEILKENYNNKLTQAKATMNELSARLSSMEVKMKSDALLYNKERTKLRMQIHGMQAILDAHRGRLEEAVNEMKLMDEKYREASTKLKKDLSNSCLEILSLRKQLTESQCKPC